MENNVIAFSPSKKINIGIWIFLILVIFYLCGIVYSHFTSKHIVSYQVLNSSLSTDNTYTGLAIREETVFYAKKNGYVNYYARETTKLGANNLVYSVDKDGTVKDLIAANLTDSVSSLNDDELSLLKSEITGFVSNFEPTNYADTYQLKYTIQNDIAKILSDTISQSLGSSNNVYFSYTDQPGYVIYSVDGYEGLLVRDVIKEHMHPQNYEKKNFIAGDEITEGEPAYKLCTSERWSLVIECSDAYANKLLEEEYVLVKFEKNQDTSWAYVTEHYNADGNRYIALTFNNSVLTFCTERFVDIEIILEKESGLKIPNTSIVEKEFFLIPDKYVLLGSNSTSNYMVKRVTHDAKGNRIEESIDISIYNYDEENGIYYVDDEILRKDDILCSDDSIIDTFVVQKTGTLIGVYNINKGYADFKQIIILSQNDEYSIIASNTDYGLSMYDYIVLDAKVVNENDFIYE